MEYRTELMRLIDSFNIEAVEEFKEAENRIVLDSRFRTIVKKKDYSGHIETLRRVKKSAQRIDPKTVDIPDGDKLASDIEAAFEKCLLTFSNVCDSYIKMQQALKDKAEKKREISYGEFKELNRKARDIRSRLNSEMHEMDILYSDLVEYVDDDTQEDFGGIEYRTYDSFTE
ncbi:MAG: hypothetical protein ACI4KL_04595 [Lentihominibacter sp.]